MLRKKWPDFFLIFITLALWCVQLAVTLRFKDQLTLEDAGESLRSPFWYLHHNVINGVASNLGFYSTIASAYELFGFSIYMAKWVRLAFHLVSLITWAWLLRRWMGAKLAVLPLLLTGLSPTWLYFNTNQTSFGLDLQYAPIWFALCYLIPRVRNHWAYVLTFLLGFIWIWAALSYPTALFYAPPLVLFLLWGWLHSRGWHNYRAHFLLGFCFTIGVLLPVVGFFLYVKNPQLLLYDSYVRGGMLRGGGGGFTRRPLVIAEHFWIVVQDLFIQSKSYSFSLAHVEWSNWLARIGVILGFIGCGMKIKSFSSLMKLRSMWNQPHLALFVWLLFFTLFLGCFPQIVATFPGIRRAAGLLVGFYGLMTFLWWHSWQEVKSTRARILIGIAFSVLLWGHVLTLYRNLKEPQGRTTIHWFAKEATLAASLDYWEKFTRDGGVLRCESLEDINCRYQEIFPAIQGYRYWSKLPQADVYAWDPKKQNTRILDLSVWESNEWPRW